MTLKWPKLRAELTAHTVKTPTGYHAGYLVRCMGSGRELGYVWLADEWHWRTADQANFGERSSQEAAIRVLREAFDLRVVQPSLPFAFEALRERLAETPKGPLPKAPYVRNRWAPPPVRDRPIEPRRAAPKPPTDSGRLRTTQDESREPPPVERKVDWGRVAPMGDVTAALSDAMRRRRE